MAYDVQVAVDCERPHELADWWAATLGWTVEEQDENFIRAMIADGHATDADTARHRGALVWKEGAAISGPDGAGRPRIYFQRVPEPRTGKNRWHLDVRVGAEHVRAVADELVARGATFRHEGQQGPHGWLTLADPEGNVFCVT